MQGQGAKRAIAAAGLVPDGEGRYTLACPACRAPVDPAQLLPPPPAAAATARRATPVDSTGILGRGESRESRRVELPPQQMAALRAQQAERKAAFERQRLRVRRHALVAQINTFL